MWVLLSKVLDLSLASVIIGDHCRILGLNIRLFYVYIMCVPECMCAHYVHGGIYRGQSGYESPDVVLGVILLLFIIILFFNFTFILFIKNKLFHITYLGYGLLSLSLPMPPISLPIHAHSASVSHFKK